MANDLEYSLGLDVSPLAKAGAAVGKFGDDTTALLRRKLSAADLGRGLLQGLGIGTVQQVADKIVAPFRASAASAERIAEFSDRTTAAIERQIALRQTELQQLETAEKRVARIYAELQAASRPGAEKTMLERFARGVSKWYGIDYLFGISAKEEQAKAEKVARLNTELEEASLAAATKRKAFNQQRDAEELRSLTEGYRLTRERETATKRLTDFELAARREKMSDDDLLADLQREALARGKEIAKIDAFRREGAEMSADGAKELLDLKQQQAAVELRIAELTERKAKGEQSIGAEVESNIAKWRNLKGVIDSFGRGEADLSDRELARKISNLNKDIAGRQMNAQAGGFDFFLEPQKNNLRQALAEQRLRSETRRNVSAFGEDRAFAMSGLTEQRFADILRGFQDNPESRRTADGIEKLTRLFEHGKARVGTVSLTPPPPTP